MPMKIIVSTMNFLDNIIIADLFQSLLFRLLFYLMIKFVSWEIHERPSHIYWRILFALAGLELKATVLVRGPLDTTRSWHANHSSTEVYTNTPFSFTLTVMKNPAAGLYGALHS